MASCMTACTQFFFYFNKSLLWYNRSSKTILNIRAVIIFFLICYIIFLFTVSCFTSHIVRRRRTHNHYMIISYRTDRHYSCHYPGKCPCKMQSQRFFFMFYAIKKIKFAINCQHSIYQPVCFRHYLWCQFCIQLLFIWCQQNLLFPWHTAPSGWLHIIYKPVFTHPLLPRQLIFTCKKSLSIINP